MTARLLDTFESRLRLEGVLTTRTALHIGAGGSGDSLGTDAPVVRTAAGLPYIPGSSLKGVLRSAAEALFRGGPGQEAQKDLWSCDPIAGGTEACVSHDKAKTIAEPFIQEAGTDRRKIAEAYWNESCAVCRLFGSQVLASRVRFADLPLCGDLALFELRNGVGIDRDKELAANGVLYDFEAVPPETRFDLRVTVDNPTDEEVGLLLYLFEELSAGNLTLGGKTSRGLGRVGVTWERIEETTLKAGNPFADLLSSRDLLAPTPAAAAPAEPEAKLPTSGDAETWKQLAEILRALPVIDKGVLGQEAGKKGLTKAVLAEKLALGKERGLWDEVLKRLTASGFLVKEGDGFAVAGRKPPVPAAGDRGGRPPALQDVIDRYAGAMARRWQEAC
jgi:CRISPR-associated RAMP protein (TIGR02581 family)